MLEPDPCCDLPKGARALAPVVAQLFGTIVDPAFDQRNDRRPVFELGKAFYALGPQSLVVCLTFGRPSVSNALKVARQQQHSRTGCSLPACKANIIHGLVQCSQRIFEGCQSIRLECAAVTVIDVAGHEASFPLQDAMAPSPFPQCRLPRCSLGFCSGNGS